MMGAAMLDSTLDTSPLCTLPAGSRRLDESAKREIDRLWRRGVSAEVLAHRFGLTPARIERILTEMRARRLLETKIEFMAHPSFDDPAAEAEILGPMPEAPAGERRRPSVPEGLPPYLASLYDVPLLTRAQEAHLFRKMNYLKYRAGKLRAQITDPAHAKASDLDTIEQLQDEALATKNQIIRANLRLVVSIAKKYLGQAQNFFELVSDGNMSLIRAVEKFDFARGNKFSTYATWAIMRNFIRSIPEEQHHRDRFISGHDTFFEAAADHRSDAQETESDQKQAQQTVQGLLDRLDERERRIITSRFGLGGTLELTLEQLGKELGITKERVRQLEARAQQKLRKFALEQKLDLSTM